MGKSTPPVDKFVAVAQCDFHEQMEVVRWLQKDPFYTVILALHHSDIYEADDFEEGQKSRVRVNGDGSQSEFFAGDAKPAHIHMIIKTATKIRASSLEKRFSGQLHFEACSDVQEYARYLTHSTFAARNKAQYNAEEIIMPLTPANGWKWYVDLVNSDDSEDICEIIEEWCSLTDTMSERDAVIALASGRRIKALSSVMSHSYFFDKILTKGG